MGRYRRKRKEPDFLDLVPPLGALLALGIFFVPGFKQLLGSLFVLVVCLAVLVAIGFIIRAIWRHTHPPDSSPTITASPDERAAFRTAFNPSRSSSEAYRPEPEPALYRPSWTRDLLSELEWKRFEDVVAAYSQELGYEAVTTRVGADGGVDVQLFQGGNPQPVMIIQCKAWDAYKVGIKPVRELFGVMAADRVPNGAFFTTGEFTAEAEEWARDKNLDLVNSREFLSRIGQLSPIAQDKLLTIATQGDYTTPTCPSCNVKMILRTASKGANAGSEFWGCRSYPRCKQTFRISKTA